MNIAKFLGTLFCRTPVMTASVTFKADIHLAKLFTIIENKADFFSIKNKDITFKNIKSNHSHKNGKTVWKHGPQCWYFCLNSRYLGWRTEHTSKQRKMVTFARNCLVKITLRLFSSRSVVHVLDHGAKASEEVQKIATDQKEYRKCSLCVIICWIAKI